MIIITTPRRIGELGRHLGRTGRGSNKQVIIRDDLIRDAPADTTLALRMMAALARRNRRVTRDIVHLKIAPKLPLGPEALERVLAVFEEEYGISVDVPRHVVEHHKGDRAPHFHVNYAMISPESGKALRFVRSAERDEMIARRLELELGEGLTPSLRVERVAQMLRERGLSEFAEIAATGPVAQKGLGRSKAEHQQADRLQADPDLLDARLLEAWRRSGGDIRKLPAELEKLGFRLAAGDKRVAGVPMVLLIDTETVHAGSLTRDLNRVRKAAGETMRIREPAMGAAVGELKPEKEVKAQLRRTAPQRADEALLGEFDRLIEEMDAAGEREEAAKAKVGRGRLAARLSAEESQTLKARQSDVRSRYRQRNRIRRARVNRSFVAAELFGSRKLRKVAFLLVSVGVLAVGGGLFTALAASGVAVGLLPSFTSAKRRRAEADQAAAVDRTAMAKELRAETQRFFRERAVARRSGEEKELARKARMRADQANRQRLAQADLLRRQQDLQRQRQLAQLEDQGRRRAALNRLAQMPGGQDPIGAGKPPQARPTARQRPRGRDIER